MIDAEERALMEETVRGAIADAVATAGEEADVDAVLMKLDWLDMLHEQSDEAIGIVFGALGATNAAATAVDDVLARALGFEPSADLAVLLPPFASWTTPGRIEAGDIVAEGLATARAASAKEILVVCGSASEPSAVLVAATAARVRRVHGLDPAGRLHAICVQASVGRPTRLDSGAWQSALALGRRAVAHQIAGASRAMLELACNHAIERMQFDQPIARFQAVRHRLAETLVAVEALEAALEAARDEPSFDTAALAKAVAGRSAHTVARHCQQVLAGIGFTTEHSFHLYLKRVLALEGLFGSADEIVFDIGRRLLAERRVPTLIEL